MSLKSKQNKADFEFKQQQIESLKQLEDSGYIVLYFGDESHFGLTPNLPYAWQTKDNPILLPAAKGKFLNVVGLLSREKGCSNNEIAENLNISVKTVETQINLAVKFMKSRLSDGSLPAILFFALFY